MAVGDGNRVVVGESAVVGRGTSVGVGVETRLGGVDAGVWTGSAPPHAAPIARTETRAPRKRPHRSELIWNRVQRNLSQWYAPGAAPVNNEASTGAVPGAYQKAAEDELLAVVGEGEPGEVQPEVLECGDGVVVPGIQREALDEVPLQVLRDPKEEDRHAGILLGNPVHLPGYL